MTIKPSILFVYRRHLHVVSSSHRFCGQSLKELVRFDGSKAGLILSFYDDLHYSAPVCRKHQPQRISWGRKSLYLKVMYPTTVGTSAI